MMVFPIGKKVLLMTICVLGVWSAPVQAGMYEDLTAGWLEEQSDYNLEALQEIWQRKVTPQKAAQRLLWWGNFLPEPEHYHRIINVLHYKLGQLTHERSRVWLPDTVAVCDALERYLALFKMLTFLPSEVRLPAVLLAGKEAGSIPETDRIAMEDVTSAPEWKAVPGKMFTAALAALPRRPLEDVNVECSQLRDGDKVIPVRPEIRLLRYFYHPRAGWQHKTVPGGLHTLDSGLQIYLLTMTLSANFPEGTYRGTVRLSGKEPEFAAHLDYQLIVAK